MSREPNDPRLKEFRDCLEEAKRIAIQVFLTEEILPDEFFPALGYIRGNALEQENWRTRVIGRRSQGSEPHLRSIEISREMIPLEKSAGFRLIQRLMETLDSRDVSIYIDDPTLYRDKIRGVHFEIKPRSSFSSHELIAMKRSIG